MLGIHISEGTAEGWFGPGLKNAIVSIVILAVLVGGIGFGIWTAVNTWGGADVNQPNAPVAPVAPAPTTAGTIQVPDGPKIKVVVSGPPELKVDWEKLGMAGFQFQLIGTVTNISKQAVKFSEIAFLLDSQQLAYIPGQTISPGGQIKIAKGFPGDYENAKVLEVKIRGFEIIGGSTTTPKPAAIEPTTKLTETETLNLSFTEEVLKNPQSPGEIVAAYCFLASQKRYSEAAKLLTKELLQRIESQGGLEQVVGKAYQGRQLKRVEFWRETIGADQINAHVDDPTLYYANGDKESDKGSISLVKEVGGWKIQ